MKKKKKELKKRRKNNIKANNPQPICLKLH